MNIIIPDINFSNKNSTIRSRVTLTLTMGQELEIRHEALTRKGKPLKFFNIQRIYFER